MDSKGQTIMALETNHYRVNDEGKAIADELGCGWTGVPNYDGSFLVSFFDDDVDGFGWELVLIFNSNEAGVPFTASGSASLTETSLMVAAEGKPVAHSINATAERINSFEDVAVVLREVKATKPPVSAVKSALNVVASKAKASGMGSPADMISTVSSKLSFPGSK